MSASCLRHRKLADYYQARNYRMTGNFLPGRYSYTLRRMLLLLAPLGKDRMRRIRCIEDRSRT